MFYKYLPLWQRNKVTALHAMVSGLIPSKVGVLNFSVGFKLGGIVEQILKLLVSVPNMPGLNPKPLYSTFILKCAVDYNDDIKPGDPLDAF